MKSIYNLNELNAIDEQRAIVRFATNNLRRFSGAEHGGYGDDELAALNGAIYHLEQAAVHLSAIVEPTADQQPAATSGATTKNEEGGK